MGCIVYGPPACGKTRNSEAIRKFVGAKEVIDDVWLFKKPILERIKNQNVVAFTNNPDVLRVKGVKVIHFDDIKHQIKGK